MGNFCGIVATLEPEKAEFRTLMDRLNRWMALEELPGELRSRLREYFHHQKIIRAAESQKELLSRMSPSLRGEVAWQCLGPWLGKVRFLKAAQREFLVEIAVNLSCIVFAPSDLAPPGFLYIIYDGIVVKSGRLLVKGGTWGEDMVLQSQWLIDSRPARATSYTATFYIDRVGLISVAERYPASLKAIRRFAIRLAVRREFVLCASLKRVKDQLRSSQRRSKADGAPGEEVEQSSQRPSIARMLDNADGLRDGTESYAQPMLSTGVAGVAAATLVRTIKTVAEQEEKLDELGDVVHAIAVKIGAVKDCSVDQNGKRHYRLITDEHENPLPSVMEA